jgi:putative ATPase
MRSSNATAAVYWVMRMLESGEDPLYIARRLLRFASEDIGNANPNALLLANVVYEACHKLGMPECNTALAQLAEYLASSKKSNAAYVAVAQAKKDINRYGHLPVPIHLRNAPTQLMKDIGYGEGYEYDHDLPGGKSEQQCMPDELVDRNYFKE